MSQKLNKIEINKYIDFRNDGAYLHLPFISEYSRVVVPPKQRDIKYSDISDIRGVTREFFIII